MASRVKTQAFPFLKPHEDVGTYIPGMTIQDFFAAHAMQAMLTTWNLEDISEYRSLATHAYVMADCMLEERKPVKEDK